ncbi:endocuticle structural protein SgAbd-6-like [Cochliomyia hominivorax]
MKLMLVFGLFALVACALAAPQKDVEIISQNSDVNIDSYKFDFATSDGTSRTEEGVIKNAGTDNEVLEVKGSFTWTAPDGQTYTVNFIADENGFQPEGAHIPK